MTPEILKNIPAPKTPQFTSTRDGSLRVPFWQSVVQGMAPDGGLLVPRIMPKLPKSFFTDTKFLQELSVSDISTVLHRLFIPRDALSDDELFAMMQEAHNFPIPLESLNAHDSLLRIDRGPTASFKDVAARSLAALVEKYCAVHQTPINIVVATSGDTGVAIADAFGGSQRVSVTILYPTDGVSEVQEKQMLEVHNRYANEQALPVKGNFDVCQDIAKLLQAVRAMDSTKSGDAKTFIQDVQAKLGRHIKAQDVKTIARFIQPINLSSANSINVWRLIPQMTQYVVAYSQLVKAKRIHAGEQVVFAVPSGNVGHLMAGMYAKALGLPVKKFIVGTNANNILANVIGSGVVKHREFVNTSSPSMDILDPSNLERLLALAGHIAKQKTPIDFVGMKRDIKQSQRSLSGVSLTHYGVAPKTLALLQQLIWAEDVETDEEVYAMMGHAARSYGTLLEPHGTTALIATVRARAKNGIAPYDQVVIFETAHPDKFPQALAHAHLEKAPHYKHATLARLSRHTLASFKKPPSMTPDLVAIAKKIATIAIRS